METDGEAEQVRLHNKLKRYPTLRLLRSVYDNKPYASFSVSAQHQAWTQIHGDVWKGKKSEYDVRAMFQWVLDEFRRGNGLDRPIAREGNELLQLINDDMTSCERVGRVGLHDAEEQASVCKGITDPRQDGEKRALPLSRGHDGRDKPSSSRVLRPRLKRSGRTVKHEDDDVDDDCEASATKRVRIGRDNTSKTTGVSEHHRHESLISSKGVNKASDEQFVDLLLTHAPHLADDDATAWARVLNALPAANPLSVRSVQGLKVRYNGLVKALVADAGNKQRKLSPSITGKLLAYRARLTVEAQDDETEKVGNRTKREPTPSVQKRIKSAAAGKMSIDQLQEPLAIWATAEQNRHKEAVKWQELLDRAFKMSRDERWR